jgi:hypothetical protein
MMAWNTSDAQDCVTCGAPMVGFVTQGPDVRPAGFCAEHQLDIGKKVRAGWVLVSGGREYMPVNRHGAFDDGPGSMLWWARDDIPMAEKKTWWANHQRQKALKQAAE